MSIAGAQTSSKPANWWDAYPKVESSPPRISPEDVAALLLSKDKSVAVIDVRRDDHGGGHVRGSEQWHAQTFHDKLPEFFDKHGDVEKVVFYCSRSNGRGPRYQDYLNKAGTTTSKAYVLEGGIIAWLEKYAGDQRLVDGLTD